MSHSPSDTLISIRQPTLLHARLLGLDLGSETELLVDVELGDHDELLKSPLFGKRVRDWVRGPTEASTTLPLE